MAKVRVKYYGVRCQTCEELIKLAQIKKDNPNTISFYAVPVDPIPCPSCGSSHLYGSKDGVEVEMPTE